MTLGCIDLPVMWCVWDPCLHPAGLAKVLQLRGASEADIATAVEQLHRMGMGRETATPPPPSQWVPHPGQVITQVY